jgi:nucleotide-binding universal stress UspA family protein
MQIKSIVVGVDFSDGSEKAAKTGLELARHHGARLYLIHAGAIPEPVGEAADTTFSALVGAMKETELREARERLEKLRERLSGQGAEVSQGIIDGPAHTALPKAAHELQADLLIAGSHGRTGIERFLMGSVAERLVRVAECPVLVVRNELPAQGATRILVPVDFSSASDKALAALPALAAEQAEIELFHVWDLPIGMAADYGGIEQINQLRGRIEQSAKRRGQEALAKGRRLISGARFESAQGSPVDTIVNRLADGKHDLAVLGSHGRSGADRLFLGSVAEKVIRYAPCSVLVVPPRTQPSRVSA